jgi:hypothetical protein
MQSPRSLYYKFTVLWKLEPVSGFPTKTLATVENNNNFILVCLTAVQDIKHTCAWFLQLKGIPLS